MVPSKVAELVTGANTAPCLLGPGPNSVTNIHPASSLSINATMGHPHGLTDACLGHYATPRTIDPRHLYIYILTLYIRNCVVNIKAKLV